MFFTIVWKCLENTNKYTYKMMGYNISISEEIWVTLRYFQTTSKKM